MKRSWSKMFGGFCVPILAATFGLSPAWASGPPQPGAVNYIEGQVSIDGQTLAESSVGSAKLTAGQLLSTQNGRVEIVVR